MKMVKRILLGLGFIMILGAIVIVSALAIMEYKTQSINDDYSTVFTDEKYTRAVSINDIQVITQSISCEYATIEMFSSWNGGDITEKALLDQYGKVVTATGKSFSKEMNKQFPEYKTTMYSYLPNTELLDKIYNSLSNGIPVPFEWAAQYEDEWTLHYTTL